MTKFNKFFLGGVQNHAENFLLKMRGDRGHPLRINHLRFSSHINIIISNDLFGFIVHKSRDIKFLSFAIFISIIFV